MPKVRGASKFVFVRHRAQDEEVKAYGTKFVLRGLAELHETDERKRLRPIVDTLYEDTSAFTHPSPRDMARFIEGMKKAPDSIEQYANLVHAMVSALCFRLNRDHALKAISQEDLQEYMTEAMRRRAM